MKVITTTLASLALAFALAASAAPAQAFYVKPCGGTGYAKTWAGAKTSCGMARATQRAYQRACEATGECRGTVYATSPVTGRTYRMHRSGSYHHGSTPLARFVGRGENGQITVFFWVP